MLNGIAIIMYPRGLAIVRIHHPGHILITVQTEAASGTISHPWPVDRHTSVSHRLLLPNVIEDGV